VVIATYNGARKLPNMVPLLALLLAREGVPVLLHGVAQEATRVGTFEILERLGHATAASIDEAEERLDDRLLAPVPLALLAPDLARLLDLRVELGVRNSGHTLAKLLLPQGIAPADACRLIAVTHPDFLALMRDYLAATTGNAFLMRGVEGEPVARLASPQPIEQIVSDGKLVTHLPGEGEQGILLPARDAEATARWTREVLDGKAAVPCPIARQAALIAEHCKSAGTAARSPLRLVSSR
jgi:anthranilate phosphoribosyltransferase